MRIPKKMLDILLKNPEVKIRSQQRKTVSKFNENIPIGSIVWLDVGKKIHIIHSLGPTYSRHEVFMDRQKADAFWTKELFDLDECYKKRLQQLNEEKVGTKIPAAEHWWGKVKFIVDGKPTEVFWGEDGQMKYKCPGCGKPFKAYVLADIPGVEEHIAAKIFDPGHDLEDRFGEGGARGTDCVCNPGKYMRTKCIAVFNKKLLNAAIKAREKFWKRVEDRFGKNRFERDKYLESREYREDRQEVIDNLFVKFKGETYETRTRIAK